MLVICYSNLNLLEILEKCTAISNFIKIRPVGAELFNAGRRTDMTKLTVSFRDFGKSTVISNFIKMRPVGAELFNADRRKFGRTDRHEEANSRFSRFCDSAQKESEILSSREVTLLAPVRHPGVCRQMSYLCISTAASVV
jgi:hypothetical protein